MKIIIVLLSIVFTSQAFSLQHRWLESFRQPWGYSHDQKQLDWFGSQQETLDSFLKDVEKEPVQSFFAANFAEDIPMKQTELENGQTVVLSLQANGFNKVLKIDDWVALDLLEMETIKTSFGLWRSVSFNTFFLSPFQTHMVVPLYEDGSSTETHLAVFELDERKLVTVIKDVSYARGHLWLDENRLAYHPVDVPWPKMFELHLDTLQTVVSQSEVAEVRGIDHGLYNYKTITSEDEENKTTELLMGTFSNPHSAYITIETDQFLNYVARTDHYFVFANRNGSASELFFVFYEFSSDGRLQLKEVKTYEPIKSGSMQNYHSMKDYLLVEYMAGPFQTFRLFDSKGEMIRLFNSPKAGNLRGIKQMDQSTFEWNFQSELNRSLKITHDLLQDFWNPNEIDAQLLRSSNGAQMVNRFLFFSSEDGTRIPVRLVHKKNLEITASTPLYIQAYGGHGLVASFRPARKMGVELFLQNGGVFAAPAIRGGSEYGEKWALPMIKSMVRYQDLKAVIEGLHDGDMGGPETTAFEGWSSGGLLAGVMLTQWPELFRLVIPGNGLQDMVRKEVLDFDMRKGWSDDYGGHQSEEEVRFLQSYSPYLQAQRQRQYPAVYVIAGAEDRRVNPSHSYKLVAALQESQSGSHPILLHRIVSSGHWPTSIGYMGVSGFTTEVQKWQVIFHQLGIQPDITAVP